jgi:hypothetical protein
MTQDAKLKEAIRARMAETGEKYTEARRALHALSPAPQKATAPDVPLPTWEMLREQVDQALRRSSAWRRTAHWTIDVLEDELGESWTVDAVEQFGELPIPVMWAFSGHMYAFVQTVDLALRLRLLQSAKGAGRIRKEIRGNRQLSRVLHVSLQATLAGLALRRQWGFHLEPGRPPADLWFETEGRRMTVETKVLEPSDLTREHHHAVDRTMDRIRDTATSQGVWVHGRIAAIPSDDLLGDIIDWISRSAGFAQNGGIVQPYRQPGLDLELVAYDDAAGRRLSGPAGGENLLPRFVRTLVDKAERMSASGAEWLCVENITGLFQTEWGLMDMARKVATLESAIQAGLPSDTIGGVIACSSAATFNGTVNEEATETDTGSIGLRYPVLPWRAREAIVIPLRDSARDATQHWRTLLEAERDWSAWALAEAGLPTFDEIIEQPATED